MAYHSFVGTLAALSKARHQDVGDLRCTTVPDTGFATFGSSSGLLTSNYSTFRMCHGRPMLFCRVGIAFSEC